MNPYLRMKRLFDTDQTLLREYAMPPYVARWAFQNHQELAFLYEEMKRHVAFSGSPILDHSTFAGFCACLARLSSVKDAPSFPSATDIFLEEEDSTDGSGTTPETADEETKHQEGRQFLLHQTQNKAVDLCDFLRQPKVTTPEVRLAKKAQQAPRRQVTDSEDFLEEVQSQAANQS